jgi:uncharacterized protein YhhL (DUF1145 family)
MRNAWARVPLGRKLYFCIALPIAVAILVWIVLVLNHVLPMPEGPTAAIIVIVAVVLHIALFVFNIAYAKHRENKEHDEIAERVAREDRDQQ